MAAAVIPYARFDYGGANFVAIAVEYDDVTLDVNVFIIDNPAGHHIVATLTKPDLTQRVRDTVAVLNGFRWDPVMPAKFVMRTGPHGIQYLWWPVGWDLHIEVTA